MKAELMCAEHRPRLQPSGAGAGGRAGGRPAPKQDRRCRSPAASPRCLAVTRKARAEEPRGSEQEGRAGRRHSGPVARWRSGSWLPRQRRRLGVGEMGTGVSCQLGLRLTSWECRAAYILRL
jgi:hypothetical protein